MRGAVVTITGPSGVGKTSLVKKLEELFPGEYLESISTTTRSMRPGELEGVNYYYVDNDTFDDILEAGEFLEHVDFFNKRYGITREEVRRAGDATATIVVEPLGVTHVRGGYHDGPVVAVFLEADEDIVRQRMLARGDSADQVESRIEHDRPVFAAFANQYDLRLDATKDLEEIARELHAFLRSRDANLPTHADPVDPALLGGDIQ